MVFAHDVVAALRAAVALVNTEGPPDLMRTASDLDAFFARFAYTGSRTRTSDEVESIRALRPQLRVLISAERDDAAEIVNRWLRDAAAVPQLTRHGAWDWHVHAVAPEAPLATRILVETAMAMIDLIRADEMSRLGRCAATGCGGVVLDLSRNRSRRYCSTSCGNREAQSMHRARRGASPG